MERALKPSLLTTYWRWSLVVVAVAAALAFSGLGALDWVDRQVHDWLTRQIPQRPPQPGIILVDIDERSLAEIGPWPWPRPVVAQLIQALRHRGARLQVWDMFFSEPASGDEALAKVLADAQDVVFGQVLVLDAKVQNPPRLGKLQSLPGQAPIPCIPESAVRGYFGVAESLKPFGVGHVSTTPDTDGVLRRLPAVVCATGYEGYVPQLSLAAALALYPQGPWTLEPPGWWHPAALSRGGARFEVDRRGMLTIPYARDHATWPAISAASLLADEATGAAIKGQVVLVGSTALGVADTTNSPRAAHAPGLSVHAELLGAALDNSWVTPAQWPAAVSALLALCISLALLPLLRTERRLAGIMVYLAPAMGVPLLVATLGRMVGILLPVAAPTASLAILAAGLLYVRAEQERRKALQLEQHLLSFLPAPLARDIARQLPTGETLGKPCQGILLAVRVQGLERWTSSVDSLQALAVAHAVSTLADKLASAEGGVVEHVHGEVLVLAWHDTTVQTAQAALQAARHLLVELPVLLQPNASLAFPLGVLACIEAGSYLLGVAGPKNLRRPLLLGPVSDQTQAMLPFCEELASPILVGPVVASLLSGAALHSLGHFLLPDHPQPRQLFRAEL